MPHSAGNARASSYRRLSDNHAFSATFHVRSHADTNGQRALFNRCRLSAATPHMEFAMMDTTANERIARCIAASKRVRWDIDLDVIRGRRFDTTKKYLPDGLSLIAKFTTLSEDEKRFVSQIQGRTYAKVFGLVERFITAKVLEVSRGYSLGDQLALEALIRFSDEELKHQALFRRIDEMVGETLPAGYCFGVDPDALRAWCLAKVPGPYWR